MSEKESVCNAVLWTWRWILPKQSVLSVSILCVWGKSSWSDSGRKYVFYGFYCMCLHVSGGKDALLCMYLTVFISRYLCLICFAIMECINLACTQHLAPDSPCLCVSCDVWVTWLLLSDTVLPCCVHPCWECSWVPSIKCLKVTNSRFCSIFMKRH